MYREALLLVAVEGMRPAEAAVVCGVTPETMRQRIRRGRAALARRLDEREELEQVARRVQRRLEATRGYALPL